MTREAMPGERIRALRERHSLSQVEFARLLGVSNVTVNRWEHDRVAPQPAMLVRLLAAERDGLLPQPLPTPLGNLPLLSGVTIGRSAEIASLARAVHESPLVTITGAGGLGKTRLAIEAVHQLAGEFERVWFIDLAAVSTGDAAIHTIARVIGLHESGSGVAAEAIATVVQNRTNLLVLDNCEHVCDIAAAIAAATIAHGGSARVLATSRLALRTPGEYRFALDPLQPDDAVALFFARAGRPIVQDDGTCAIVAGVCQRLDRLPLAIELAAARTPMLSVAQIAERLDRGFELLRGGAPAPGRWQAIEAMIAWSYDLLDPETAGFFRALGVFAGGFDLAAVEAVTQYPAAIDFLSELANHSLIVVEWPTDRAAARYRLLESLAAYARRQLVETRELSTLAQRHAEYVANFVADAVPRLRTSEHQAMRAQLDREHGNIIAALEWAQVSRADELMMRIVDDLSPYWHSISLFREARTWIDRALALTASSETLAYGRLLANAAKVSIWEGDLDSAEATNERLFALADAAKSDAARADAFDVDGLIAMRRNELPRAAQSIERARQLHEQVGNTLRVSRMLLHLGVVANLQSQHDQALGYLFKAWNVARSIGDLDIERFVMANLAQVSLQTGAYASGRDYNNRAAEIARLFGYEDSLAFIRMTGAQFDLLLGDERAAVTGAREALEQFERSNNQIHLGEAGFVLGTALAVTGDLSGALRRLRQAAEREYRAGNLRNLLACFDAIAHLQAAAGDPALAARLQSGAEQLRATRQLPRHELFDYATATRITRAKLSEQDYAASCQTGRALELDALLAEAMNLGMLRAGVPLLLIKQPASGISSGLALTERQRDVLRLVAAGRSNRKIGEELAISTRTVERHLSMIFNELGVDRRSAAIAVAAERGLL